MSDIEFRTIEPHERDAVLNLLGQWFNDREFFARYFEHDPTFRDDLCFVAAHEGQIVSTLQVFRKQVRLDSAVVEVGGVGNVFTTEAYRERGLASVLLTRAIAAMEAQGFDLSLLFATRLQFYGSHGWRSHVRNFLFIEGGDVAVNGPCVVEPFHETDLDAVMHIYEHYNAGFAGPTLRDRRYWLGQLRYAGNKDEDFVVARNGQRIVAYARGTALYGFYAIMEHGHLPGHEAAMTQLVCHLHASAPKPSPGTITQLTTAPVVEQQLRERGLTLRGVEDSFWMWRIISPRGLATKLRVDETSLDADDLFFRLLPPERSVYWIADRF